MPTLFSALDTASVNAVGIVIGSLATLYFAYRIKRFEAEQKAAADTALAAAKVAADAAAVAAVSASDAARAAAKVAADVSKAASDAALASSEQSERVRISLAESDKRQRTRLKRAAVKVEEVKQVLVQSNVNQEARQDETAHKVEQVAVALAHSTDASAVEFEKIGKVTTATHTLVNSNFGVQLRLNKVLARKLADAPGATDEDRRVAEESERLYDQHMAAQKVVDDRTGTDAEKKGHV